MTSIAFFNNQTGGGQTSLVYHLAWMFAEIGISTVAVDCDPQSTLTGMFLEEDALEQLWPDGPHPSTLDGALAADAPPKLIELAENLALLPGDPRLALVEDAPALHHVLFRGARERGAGVVLLDVAPNFGPLSRAAVQVADYLVIPVVPSLLSVQALANIGNRWQDWRRDSEVVPIGYTIEMSGRRAQLKWVPRIPAAYRTHILGQSSGAPPSPVDDPDCLAVLRNYPSLMQMATEARKPMFALKPADGALAAHGAAVADCRADFERLARKVATICKIDYT